MYLRGHVEYFDEEDQDWDNESQIPGLVYDGRTDSCTVCLGDGVVPATPIPPKVDGFLYLWRYITLLKESWHERRDPWLYPDESDLGHLNQKIPERSRAVRSALETLSDAVDALRQELLYAEVVRARRAATDSAQPALPEDPF